MHPILLVVLVLLLVGAVPHWNYNQSWGYAPFAGIGGILIVILILVLFKFI